MDITSEPIHIDDIRPGMLLLITEDFLGCMHHGDRHIVKDDMFLHGKWVKDPDPYVECGDGHHALLGQCEEDGIIIGLERVTTCPAIRKCEDMGIIMVQEQSYDEEGNNLFVAYNYKLFQHEMRMVGKPSGPTPPHVVALPDDGLSTRKALAELICDWNGWKI